MAKDISPLDLIEIAILGQYDTATAYSEHMRVETNAKLDRELTVEGRNKALNVLTSSLASVQIIAIYHHRRSKTQKS